MLRRIALTAGLLAVTLGWTNSAQAQRSFGQSFTAPAAPDTRLLSISASGLRTFSTDLLTASIFAFTPTAGGGGTLAGASVFSQAVDARVGVSLSPNITLVGGSSYALLLTGPDLFASGASPNSVPGGAAVECTSASNGAGCILLFGEDFDIAGVTVTFGPTTTVPEPSTYALLGTGLLTVGGIAARRKRHG